MRLSLTGVVVTLCLIFSATAAEAHNRLMLTKALDLSAKLKQPVKLPLEPDHGR